MAKNSEKHEGGKSKKKVNKGLRIFLKIILVILIIMLILCGAASWYLHSLLSKMNYVKLNNVIINEGVEESLKGYRNVALLGIDSRANTYDNSRSDCIIIVSLNQDTNEVTLASIYRDTYVHIDGYGYDKITHAYAYGGPELAVNTINQNLDLNITEFVAVNFDAVVDVIDAIGGITLDIDAEEAKYINAYINEINSIKCKNSAHITKAGRYNLDGVQALAYSRIRYTAGGDYKRAERMRIVLNATFEKAKGLNVAKLNALANKLLPEVFTNISSAEVFAMLPSLASIKVKSDTGWPYEVKGITLDRWYGVPVTLERNVKKLHAELFGDEEYEVSEKVKGFSNNIIKKTGYR